MAKSEANIHVYGDLANGVYVSESGATVATMPTDLASLSASTDFDEVGWISEDGVNEAIDSASETFRAWQGATVVRKQITQSDRTFTFTCLEENAITAGLKYRGQTVTTTSGVSKVTVKDQTKTDIRSWVIDLYDGAHQKRYPIKQGFYELTGESTYAAAGITTLEFTVTPIGDYEEISGTPVVIP